MARHYRMTPRRKAALRKAQAASARKRRRRGSRLAVATGVTVLAVTAAAGGAAYYHHRKGQNITQFRAKSAAIRNRPGRVKLSRSKELDVVRVTGLGADVGRSMFPPAMRRTVVVGHHTDIRIGAFDRAAKARARGVRQREKELIRNQRKRIKYWKQKKIPKRNRYTRRWGIR